MSADVASWKYVVIFSALLCCGAAYAADDRCSVVSDSDHGWSVMIDRPGAYCVAADLKQQNRAAMRRFPHQSAPDSPLLTIASADVNIDLAGHVLKTKQPYGQGAWLNRGGKQPLASVQLRNGSIHTENAPAVYMVHAWNRRNQRFVAGAVAVAGGLAVARDSGEYRRTAFVLEDLTLEAKDVVVILQGRDNIIRRCKIIGGNSPVNLYGPGLVFEDNEIVMNAQAGGEPPVALYLEDAQGSVVRNNRITMHGQVAGAEAIVLKNSPDVALQNNGVNGGLQTYKLLDPQSSVRRTG